MGRKLAKGLRERKSVIVLVCEGKTEKIYFNNFKNRDDKFVIKIETSEATDIHSMAERARHYYRKKSLYRG